MADSLDQNLVRYLPAALEFIEQALMKSEGVLVHCNAGVSRSGAVCVAYVMKKYKIRVQEAIQRVKAKRAIVSPNSNFVEQLESVDFDSI